MEFYRNSMLFVADENKGGELSAYYNGEKVINRFWMHSSPEGACDGSDLGYEMSKADCRNWWQDNDATIFEGRLCRSNGDGSFFGHRYRRTYKFYKHGFTTLQDMWISNEDIAVAKSRNMFAQWGSRPPMFYVWANPLDVMRKFNHWSANWYKCWDTANYSEPLMNVQQGAVPTLSEGMWNRGYCGVHEHCNGLPEVMIYEPGGIGFRRYILEMQAGYIDMHNIWHNSPNDITHTVELSTIGGDRYYFDPYHKYLTPLHDDSFEYAPCSKQEIAFCNARHTVTRFLETVEIWNVDNDGNLISLID